MRTLRLNYCLPAILLCSLALAATLTACGKDEKKRPDVTEPYMPDEPGGGGGELGTILMSDVKQVTAFNAGDDGVNTYRIPSIVTAKDGSLLVFAEARYTSWQDKSYTDVVVKRSTDGGLTWSAMNKITASINASGAYAFMDPLPVVDKGSGRVYLFCTRWLKGNATPTTTRAFMCVSNDNGLSWTTPSDVTAQIAATDCLISGFGPGAGLQIASGTYANRLIVPTRQYNPTTQLTYINTVYSTDGGNNWLTGKEIRPAGECSMADCGNNKLSVNVRSGGARAVGSSTDGGNNWSAPTTANSAGLPAPAAGCHASVYGTGNGVVFFAGAQGGVATSSIDDRNKLMIFRSVDGAVSWGKKKELWSKACSYTSITQLADGKLAIVFECGENQGFIKQATRPAGWMRLDVVIIPQEVTQNGYWFE